MRMQLRLSNLLLSTCLLVGAMAANCAAADTLLVHNSDWSTLGASTAGGAFTNFLLPPTTNPQFYRPDSGLIFGNTITTGAGSATFNNVSVDLKFALSEFVIADEIDVHGTISGAITDTSSNAHIQFDTLTDLTTSQVDTIHTFIDPVSNQQALMLNTRFGTLYVDYTEPIPTPLQNQSTLSGAISIVGPELGSWTGMFGLLVGGGLLGMLSRRRGSK